MTFEPAEILSRSSRAKTRIYADLFAFLILVIGIQLRFGYGAGINDHFVLSPLGISWSDPTAFANDYFVFNSPQPHIFFDFVTSFGYGIGAPSATYFAFWLVTIAVSAIAIRKISEVMSPKNVFFATGFGSLLLVAGPVVLLGTTTIALPQALPHSLGGALVLLMFGFCLENKWSLAGVSVVLASIAHVQHGTVGLLIYLFFLAIDYYQTRSLRVVSYFLAATALVTIIKILSLRQVVGDLSDFVRVCNLYITYHCDSNSWSPNRFVLGICVAGMLLIAATSRKSLGFDYFRIFAFTFSAGGATLVILEFINFPFLGEFIQGTNGFRIFSLLISLGAISGAWIIVNAHTLSFKRLLLGLLSIFVFLTAEDDVGLLSPYSFIVAVILVVFYFKVMDDNSAITSPVLRAKASSKGFIGLFASISIVTAIASGTKNLQPDIAFMSEYRNAFRLEQIVPSGETIAADPNWAWVRLASKRAVIVDCKYKPYGGAPLVEFESRLESIGGYQKMCIQDSFRKLKPAELDIWAEKYSAKYLLLDKRDKRIPKMMNLGWTMSQNPESKKIVAINRSLVLLEKTIDSNPK
jgi:hypothetical protein